MAVKCLRSSIALAAVKPESAGCNLTGKRCSFALVLALLAATSSIASFAEAMFELMVSC